MTPLLRSLTFTHPSALSRTIRRSSQAIAFSSTSDNPTNFGLDPTRTLSWFIYDGDALNDVQTTVLSITALADAPVNTVPGRAERQRGHDCCAIAGVSVADVDSAHADDHADGGERHAQRDGGPRASRATAPPR